MRARFWMWSWVVVTVGLGVACSEGREGEGAAPEWAEDGGEGVDAGEGGVSDAGVEAGTDGGLELPDAGPTPLAEVEPNNGTSASDVQTLGSPRWVNGRVDPSDDVDVYSLNLSAGELWQWALDAQGSAFSPHLAVVEHAQVAPPSLGFSGPGGAAVVEAFVLRSGRYNVIVRDARNVPAQSSTHQGGSGHSYALVPERSTRAPTPLPPLPVRLSGLSLASPFAVQTFRFTLSTQTEVELSVWAARRTASSELDTRLSLYRTEDSLYLGTNDDLSLTQTDSQLGGVLAPGTYIVVVDNVNPTAGSLGFDLDVAIH